MPFGVSTSQTEKYCELTRTLPKSTRLVQRIEDHRLVCSANEIHVASSSDGELHYWISASVPVGIDAEPHWPNQRIGWKTATNLIKTFSDTEKCYISSLRENMRDPALQALWTRKEALAKCCGLHVFHTLSYDTVPAMQPAAVVDKGNKKIIFLTFKAKNSFVSICYDITRKSGGKVMDKKDIESGILTIVADYLESTGKPADGLSVETRLIGSEAALTSVGLVTIIMDVEAWLSDQGIDVSLTSEKAMSMTNSPFRSIESLVDFVIEEDGSGE